MKSDCQQVAETSTDPTGLGREFVSKLGLLEEDIGDERSSALEQLKGVAGEPAGQDNK